MKEKKFLKYVEARRNNRYPFRKNHDVKQDNDPHINQDFTGYPHPPASKELVKPKTKTEKKIASLGHTDGEKINYDRPANKKSGNNKEDDGSANAFEATETVQE